MQSPISVNVAALSAEPNTEVIAFESDLSFDEKSLEGEENIELQKSPSNEDKSNLEEAV